MGTISIAINFLGETMTTDLTRGSAIKQILLFSIPYLIGNLFQQFYNIADMVIVGRTLDPLAYTAVGATGGLVWFASGAIQSLTAGFAAVTARYFGANDEDGIKRSFASAIKLSAIISILLAVACVIFARPILELLRTPDDIIDRSYSYIVWIFGGLIATALFNLLSNMVRSLGDSKTPLYFLIIACIVNIILDFVFISFCGMDTDGAGLATVLAQLISGLICIVYIAKKHPLLHVRAKHFARDLKMDLSLLRIGVPVAFLNMVLSVGSIIMQFVTNGLGTVYVSAQTTGSKIETFLTQPILSLGSSVSVFAAQNLGAKKHGRIVEGGRKTLLLSFGWCVIAAAILIPFGRFFVTLLAGNVSETVIDHAYHFIIINTAMSVFLAPLVIYKSILQAVGRTTWSMVSGFTEIIGRAGLSAAVMALMGAMVIGEDIGYIIMCFASPLAWIFGLLTIILDYVFMARKFKHIAIDNGENTPIF